MPKMHHIIPPNIAITTMQSNGYKDAAYAVAELIDNSIQAGEGLSKPTNVELICVEENHVDKSSRRITEIAVYDDAVGMSKDELWDALQFGGGTRRGAKKGMGKFGFGLPNSSISQCDRVEVYSWQKGVCLFSYLDVDEVAAGKLEEIPEPKKTTQIPEVWKKRIKSPIRESGTLVIWSRLTRLKWKKHMTFFNNTEFLIGRIYRHFIDDKKCTIRLACYSQNGKSPEYDEFLKPNDPLYLMTGTNAPHPFDEKPAFDFYVDQEHQIEFKGKKHTIRIRASHSSVETRAIAHDDQHKLSSSAEKNVGVSVIRAGRELELNQSFVNQYVTTERWWGVEIFFDPDLDDVFGVTNNKQHATAFKRITKQEAALQNGMETHQVMDLLKAENDPLHVIIEVTHKLDEVLKQLRKEVDRTAFKRKLTSGKPGASNPLTNAANEVAQGRDGKGDSDKADKALTPEQKKAALEEAAGKDPNVKDKAKTIEEWLESGKYIIDEGDIEPPYSIFGLSRPAGKLRITVNTAHPAWINIFKTLESNEPIDSALLRSKIRDSVLLIIAAWTRVEDELKADSEKDAEKLIQHRLEWGRIAKEMIEKYNTETNSLSGEGENSEQH